MQRLQIVPVRPYSADLLQRSTIGDTGCSFWCAQRLSARSAVGNSVHSGLAHVVARGDLSLHQYADDSQVYMSMPVDSAQAAVHQISTCLVDVEAWLKASHLRLNLAKTQVTWLGSQHLLSRLDIVHLPILSLCIPVQETARDLGVVIDSRLSLGEHVASVSRSGYYQLRQLRPVVRCLSDDATKTLVHAFIARTIVMLCFWHHE